MFECSSLFQIKYSRKKRYPKLERSGIVVIDFSGMLASKQISLLLTDIHFIITVYKKACKRIVFRCNGVFTPKDMFVYVLFETIVYTLKVKYGYDVDYILDEAKSTVFTPGLVDSQLVHFFNYQFDIELMEKTYNKIHTGNHFRRIIHSGDIGGASIILSELKVFFSTFEFDHEYGLQLARVASELVDNASEHAVSDCLIDLYVSDPTYKKTGCDDFFYAISMVVLDFSEKKLHSDIRRKIETGDYKGAKRYNIVREALENHRPFFKKDKYEEEDFYNIASFQDRISGRSSETETGGTGLTELIKCIEDKAEAHQCYVLSGNKGLWFEPEYLKYNENNWIGFNVENDFLKSIPDFKILVRSDVVFTGTGYNFVLVVKKENSQL